MSQQEFDKRDYPHIFAYENTASGKYFGFGVWCFGFEFFGAAKVVKDFEWFKVLNFMLPQQKMQQGMLSITLENTIDQIRIIIAFENYMKGELIQQGYLAHDLVGNHPLAKDQKKRPIKVDEVFSSSFFENFDPSSNNASPTTQKTLMFSRLLEPNYQTVISIPSDVIGILTKLNNERNKLHFYFNGAITFGKRTVDEYSMIIDFANNVIKSKILALNLELNGRPE